MSGVTSDVAPLAPVGAVGRRLAPGGGQTLKAFQLRQVVDHDLPHAVVEGLRQLRLRLVVAVEVDGLRGEAHALGHGQLPAGHHVHAQPLLLDQAGQRGADVGLGRVGDLGVGMRAAEGVREGAAAAAEGLLAEDVEGRAELAGHLGHVDSPHLQVATVVHAPRVRKDVLQLGVVHVTSSSCGHGRIRAQL